MQGTTQDRKHADGLARALAMLKQNDIRVAGKLVDLETSRHRPGVKLLGVIDYLKKFHGYHVKRAPPPNPWIARAGAFIRRVVGGGS
jgi:hypothetical protein